MAGLSRPDVDGLRGELSIKIEESIVQYKGVNNSTEVSSNYLYELFDGIETPPHPTGVVLMTSSHYITFTSHNDFKIWAVSNTRYSDTGGSYGKNIKLEKWGENGWYFIGERTTKNDGTWYELTPELESGRYRISGTGRYTIFDEWYIERVLEERMAIKNHTTSKVYSLDSKTLIHLPSLSDKNMILHGLEAGNDIKLDEDFNKIKYVNDINNKIVTQPLDKLTNKILKIKEV